MYSVHNKFYRHTTSGDDSEVKHMPKYECEVWEKGAVVEKRKKALPFLSQFPRILLSCLGFLHFMDPTISEPGTG